MSAALRKPVKVAPRDERTSACQGLPAGRMAHPGHDEHCPICCATPPGAAPCRRHGKHQLGSGRAARTGNGVFSLLKYGIGAFGAFGESLCQEVARRYVQVSLVEPGATATELASHNRPEALQSIRSQFGQRMEAGDIADAITYIVTRPRHVAVN